MDKYGMHEHPRVRDWFVRHPEFVVPFTPTSSSWLNQVGRFFAAITGRRIRRGVFRSVEDLERAIEDCMRRPNAQPRPFCWTKDRGFLRWLVPFVTVGGARSVKWPREHFLLTVPSDLR
jgi:hypothetical protein